MKRLIAATLVFAALLALMATPASAQYPPPAAPITIEPSDANPEPGETITLDIVVLGDATAAVPSGGTSMVLAAFQTAGPPYTCSAGVTGGEGASVSPTDFTTDDQGRASLDLFVGTEPALLTVSVQCGDLGAQIMVPVGDVATPTSPPGTATPTTSPGGPTATTPSGASPTAPPGPPDTGTGAAQDSESSLLMWLIVVAPVIALAIGGTAFAIRRRT